MKTYVEVEAKFDVAGRVRPTCVIWEDGRRFEIDRVKDIRQAASLKIGGCGMRYRCEICGRETDLYFEDPKWFVDSVERTQTGN